MNARIPDDALPPTLDPKALQAFVDDKWDNEIIPALTDYQRTPVSITLAFSTEVTLLFLLLAKSKATLAILSIS